MQNREPTYPGRVTLTPVSGQANTYDMERADKPLQQGTPLTKATFLKDATAALYGLGTKAVPDDVLAELGRFQSGLGNEYIWEKNSVSYLVKETAWSFNGQFILAENGDYPLTIQYSSGVVNDNGSIKLQEPVQSITLTSYSQSSKLSSLLGKYFEYTYTGSTSPGVGIYRLNSYSGIGNNSTWGYVYFEMPTGAKCSSETSIQLIGYVNSPNANAYPPAVPDGYTYTPLGQLGDQVRIETGSYVGTGTYGASNPNTLTFGFKPKMVFMTDGRDVFDERYTMFFPWIESLKTINVFKVSQNDYQLNTTISGNTISWFTTSNASFQWNEANRKYCYLAIC